MPHEIDSGLLKSKQEEMWHDYCEMVKCEDTQGYIGADRDEHEASYITEAEEIYYHHPEPYDDYYEDSSDEVDDIIQELDEYMENDARSRDTGWYYPDREGSLEDNLSDED